MRDVPRLGHCVPDGDCFGTLSKAMERDKPIRVRRAAYGVMLVAGDGWLKSAGLRQTLQDLDFPRQLHSVVIETGRSDYQHSFLMMMEILSEDKHWHSYLRGAMVTWLPFHQEGPAQVLQILSRVGELSLPEYDTSIPPPFNTFLANLVKDEWARVPGRPVADLTTDLLTPLAEVTNQLKQLLFTEIDRRAVLAEVENVIPSLEKRRDDGFGGPGEDICGFVDDLLERLRVPMPLTGR